MQRCATSDYQRLGDLVAAVCFYLHLTDAPLEPGALPNMWLYTGLAVGGLAVWLTVAVVRSGRD